MATTPAKRPQGVVQRFKGAVVEAGRSFFPSMGWRDWRSVLRGEAAPRPNPRMRVNSNSFWYHIRPRALPLEATAWYYTFGLGWMSAFFFVLEAITGMVLMVYYTPSPDQAYSDMLRIISDVPLGQLMRNMHRLGAHFMVAIVFLHMMRTFFTASYKAPRQFIWVTGVILLLFTAVLSFSGYLLPWDQLAYWAVTIGSSMADAAPFIGNATNLLLRGGVDIGAGALLRFYLLHIFALPMLTLLLISVHYYAVRKQDISPLHELFENKPPTRRKIPFLPDQVFFEIAVIGLLTFAFVVINAYFWNSQLESHANPTQTPNHTQAPWYFLWLQGMLKFGDKQWFGIGWPPVIILGLLVLPYLDRNPSRRFKDRKVAIGVAIAALIGMVYLTNAGSPNYGIQQTAASEISQEWVPVEGEGIVDTAIKWEDIPDQRVVYDTDKKATVQGPALADLKPDMQAAFAQFQADVEKWKKLDTRFRQPHGTLSFDPFAYETDDTTQKIIVDRAGAKVVKLKRATVNLDWTTTNVDANGKVTDFTDAQGKTTLSLFQQSRYLDRDSHDARLQSDASPPRPQQ
ncbi:MAG: cytochrome bc complex cytochrome b subunit [Herpetosiphonaceae bacterium]|nr:cytochrome bc complex cytochrome b subunit [Herpetosiphonaceae bacterium]